MTQDEKDQRELFAAIHARRSASCNTSQLTRDLPRFGRSNVLRQINDAVSAGLVRDVSDNSAYRWRLTPAGKAKFDAYNRAFWSEVGAAVAEISEETLEKCCRQLGAALLNVADVRGGGGK